MRTAASRRLGALACLVVGLAVTVGPGLARAQEAGEPEASPGQQYYDDGRQLYRERQYAEAFNSLVRAIQADPLDPRYYVGAARAANFADQLDLAVIYYDTYLTHFEEHAESARRRADRTAAIRRERDEANERRATPDVPAVLPEAQTAALAVTRERLATGPYITLNATGAYAMYQTLLRTGYAQPDLAEIREQLTNGILTETQALFWPTPESPVPLGDINLWESIRGRYEAVEALGRPVLTEPVIQARVFAAEGLLANLNANTMFAIERFQRAIELDPNLLAAHIGLLMAAHDYAVRQGCCAQVDVEATLAQVERLLELQAPQHLPILPLLRGMVESDRGETSAGAERVIELLAPERRAPGSAIGPPPTTAPVQPSGEPSDEQPDDGVIDEEGPKPDELLLDDEPVETDRPTTEGTPPAEL